MQYQKYPYELPPLPYEYDALEPYIDAETMEVHHNGHFKTYINNLNKALAPYPRLQKLQLPQLLTNFRILPPNSRINILRNAGGVYNHTLFFEGIAPPKEQTPPSDKLSTDINKTFGSFENFKKIFSENAMSVFGSGWTFLTRNNGGALRIVNTKNQNTPLPLGLKPIMLFDVWEHAYYLKYKNLRVDYVNNLWNVVTFKEI